MEQGLSCDRVRPGLCFPPQGSQHELVAAVQRGDKAAFQQLIATYDERVLRFALTVTGSEKSAQEIFCQVFGDLFVLLNRRGAAEPLFILVHRILANRCIEFCRQQKMPGGNARSGESSGRFNRGSVTADTFSNGGDGVAQERVTRRALESLTPRQRIVFQLKQHHGLKVQTLAEIFQVTPAKIGETLQAAIRDLRSASKAVA